MEEKIKYNEEIEKKFGEMTGSQILRHICQLMKLDENGKLAPHGSGVFVIIKGIHFLLTASHVVEDWTDNNQLFIRIGLQKHVSLVGIVRETDIGKSDKVDIAYVKLDERIISDLNGPYIFLPLNKIREHKKMLDSTQYCIMGYPEKSKKEYNGRKESSAQAFYVNPCKEKVYKYYKFNPQSFHLLEMKGKGNSINTGKKKKIDSHFYGMSGCGLWLLILNYDGKQYTTDYRLIGIMSEFKKGKYFCMIGVKVAIIIKAIIHFENINLKEKQIQ